MTVITLRWGENKEDTEQGKKGREEGERDGWEGNRGSLGKIDSWPHWLSSGPKGTVTKGTQA